MRPYEAKKLPIEYKMDKELIIFISEANQKYGEYKTLLENLNFESHFFLNSILLTESFKSTQIEGTQVTQDEIYYLKYMDETDDYKEIHNLKNAIAYAFKEIKQDCGIHYTLVNEMHQILLNSVRGAEKEPGEIRKIQNWIGPRGVGIEGAIFIPPAPEHVYDLLQNLYEYMNDAFIDPIFINIALSHAQFETIHPYKDGNGRLGRALIPIQLAYLTQEKPILFMSEILEVYKPSYQRYLMESRRGNYLGYLKFFLQCMIDQCNSYIYKLKRVREIYEADMKAIEKVNSALVYKIMPIIMTQIVFTKKEIEQLSGVSKASVSRIINKLVELGIIVPDKTVVKKGFRYEKLYNVFVGRSY